MEAKELVLNFSSLRENLAFGRLIEEIKEIFTEKKSYIIKINQYWINFGSSGQARF